MDSPQRPEFTVVASVSTIQATESEAKRLQKDQPETELLGKLF